MAKESHNFLGGGFDLPKLEEKVLAFWDKNKIFEKSLEKNQPKGKTAKSKTFVFYEGPPYANGKPAIHHVFARVVKDVMLRYKTMRGYYVPRKAGWDTHGLPVEMAAEKALGLKSKRDIEKYGVKLFNEKAKEQVWLHKDEWERLTRRIGYWLDLKNAYVTYAPEYIETIWWTLAQLWKHTLLFKGHKVVPWCTRCGTALSSHELAQGYQEVTDSSVYVKFKLKPTDPGRGATTIKNREYKDIYVLSWTTTPWTLPGNVALAVGENISYAITEKNGESLIVAEDSPLGKELGSTGITGVKGKDLVGLEYEPLFEVEPLKGSKSYRIYDAPFVTTKEGTGVVHTAVMYGEDDYALGKKIGLPEHHTVDEEGKFTKDVPELKGEYVRGKATEEKIFDHLKRHKNFVNIFPYTHEYPHCWRCGTPILYYARDSWFIGMSKLRTELLKSNKTINWMPAHVKEGRFGEWLREAKDWNLSRERYWGAPLPIWECKKCGHTEVVEGLDELSRLAGGPHNSYWAMRHGEAENNVLKIADSGSQNSYLTLKGKKQVEASLKKLRQKIDLIFSSEVLRARETATLASEKFGVKVIFDKRLNEIHWGPEHDGRPVKEYLDRLPNYQDRFEKNAEKIESFRDIRKRVWEFLMECEREHKGKNILIVSHGDPIWMLLHAGVGSSEAQTIRQKRVEKDFYPQTGEIKRLMVRVVPRNETGEVDLHRPFADTIVLDCPKCKAEMKRVREVADVWYDSGAMPLAQAHFPFELGAVNIPSPEKAIDYPADYIAEGMDQTRGWFYTMLAIATALGYKAPYKNVITFGLINDKYGKKMSKSKGNIVEPFPVIDKYGVDAVRWYFYAGTPFSEPKNFDEAEIGKAFRKTHLIIYNSFMFWDTYALKTGANSKAPVTKHILDKWILARLDVLVDAITKKLDHYEIREAALEIENFTDGLSRWYIRRSRRRLQKIDDVNDHKAASATLGYVLLSLVKLMAPFTPFFSEGLYAPLGGEMESVHLDEWPKKTSKKASDTKLLDAMEAVRGLATQGLAKRAEAGVKVRQPLASLTIGAKLSDELQKILADEVNVKKIVVKVELEEAVELDAAITPELREEGLLREVARMVQELRQRAGLQPKDEVMLLLDLPAAAKHAIQKHEAALRSDVGARAIEYGRSKKFNAEELTKLDDQEAWIGIRKV